MSDLERMKEVYVQCELCGTPNSENPMGDGRSALMWLPAKEARPGNIIRRKNDEWYICNTGRVLSLGEVLRQDPDFQY